MPASMHHGEPIIDCDVHQLTKSPKDLFPYLPRAYQERIELFGTGLSQRTGYPNGGNRGWRADAVPEDGSPVGSDLPFMQRQHLDPYNIEYAILLGQEFRPIPSLPDVDYAAALSGAYNDWMIEHWLEQDERLKGCAIIPVQEPHLAAKELERIGSHPDIVGALVPNGSRVLYGQRFYDPVFDACVNLDLPFVIHTGNEGPGMNGQPSYYVEKRQGRPLGYMEHLASMIFEGLFERYPTLKVVFVEGGFVWLPAFLWHIDADWKALSRETPWVKRPPSEYVFEHCRFTSQPMEQPEPIRRLLTMFEWARAEQTLMFASDYPHFDFDSPEQSIPALPEALRRRIFYETAQETFKLPSRQPALASV
ncbi:MAG TPA: amidohydrolase family protein [Thermomicrobiaceae bacterium]|nr:amidohydrolase family protein [Thermomicrobiaceae bacterium]